VKELAEKGVNPFSVAPPAFQFLWAHGWNVPPPYFIPFWPLAVFSGAIFGLGFGVASWLVIFIRESALSLSWTAPPLGIMTLVLISGVPFGLIFAGYYRYAASNLGLPTKWSEYRPLRNES
jgi:Family of unknown function (DUF6404)